MSNNDDGDTEDVRVDESPDNESPDVFRGLMEHVAVADRPSVQPLQAIWNGDSETIESAVPYLSSTPDARCEPGQQSLSASKVFDFDDFYMTHYKRLLFRLIRYCANDKALAEDIVQQTFIKAYVLRAQLPELDDPAEWLYTVATRAAKTIFKREQLGRDKMRRYLAAADLVAEPMESVLVVDLIDRLPERERLIIRYRYLCKYERKRIAELIGVSLRTVDYSIKKGLERLRLDLAATKEDQL